MIDPVHSEEPVPRLLTKPPFITEVFLGRDKELKKISDQFGRADHKLIFINGEGGMGKTTLAAKFWDNNEKNYRHLIWLYCNDSIVKSIQSLSNKLNLPFNSPAINHLSGAVKDEDRFNQIIMGLANLNGPCLMILDNANKGSELEAIYGHLSGLPNFHIIITSRLESLAEIKPLHIPRLPENQAAELFLRNYEEIPDDDLNMLKAIIDAIGGNTLVIEILAKSLHEINRYEQTYGLKELLNDLQNKGLLLVKGKPVKLRYHEEYVVAEPKDIISAMYDVKPLSTYGQLLLCNFSILPAEKIEYPTFRELISPVDIDEFEEELRKVASQGWIEFDPEMRSFKISPVVQEVVIGIQLDSIEEYCGQLVINLTKRLEAIPEQIHIRFANSVIRQIKIDCAENAMLVLRLAETYCSNGDSIAAINVLPLLSQYLQTLSDSREYEARLIKLAYDVAARIYCDLGNYAEARSNSMRSRSIAKRYYYEVSRLLEANLSASAGKFELAELLLFDEYKYLTAKGSQRNLAETINLAQISTLLGKIARAQKRFTHALKMHKETIALFGSMPNKGPQNMAFAKATLAATFIKWGGHLAEASTELKDAEKILKAHLSLDSIFWGTFFNTLGDYYESLPNYPEALSNYDKGQRIITEKSGGHNPGLFDVMVQICLMNHNDFLHGLKDKKALKHSTIELTTLLLNDYEEAAKRFGHINPSLHEALSVARSIATSLEELAECEIFTKRINEFQRLRDGHAVIRTGRFILHELSSDIHEAFYAVCKLLFFLPEHSKDVEITSFKLPFFKDLKLYLLVLKDSPQVVRRYALYDGKRAIAVNYTAQCLLDLCTSHAELNENNLVDFARYYNDSVCEPEGSMYFMDGPDDVPWRLDVNMDVGIKDLIRSCVQVPELVPVEGGNFSCRYNYVYQNSIYRVDMVITGRYTLSFRNSGILVLDSSKTPFWLELNAFSQGKRVASHLNNQVVELQPEEEIQIKFPVFIA